MHNKSGDRSHTFSLPVAVRFTIHMIQLLLANSPAARQYSLSQRDRVL
jgi:hypothetical protein